MASGAHPSPLVCALGASLFLFLLVALAGAAGAVVPSVPAALVLEVESSEEFNPDTHAWTATSTLNLRLSANDPDQVNGSWEYRVWFNGSKQAIEPTTPLAGRAGWLTFPLDLSGAGPADYFIQVSANDTANATESVLSCGLTVNFRTAGAHHQCGSAIAAPEGVTLGVLTAPNATVVSQTRVGWSLSVDHADNWSYWIYTGQSSEDMFRESDDSEAEAVGGARFLTRENAGLATTQTSPLYVKVLARDNLTLQRSEFSCTAYVTEGIRFSTGACGNLNALNLGPVAGEPTFPFLNIPQVARESGLPEGLVVALVAVLFTAGLAVMMLKLAGPAGGVMAGITGLGFTTVLGLVPVWGIVLVFMLAACVVVFLFRGGGE